MRDVFSITLCWIAILVCEGVVYASLFPPPMGRQHLELALMAHVLACVMPLWGLRRKDGSKILSGIQFMVVLLLPVLGAGLALLMDILRKTLTWMNMVGDYRDIVRRKSVQIDMGTSVAMTAERIREQIDITPMVEIIDSDDFIKKRQAIERLSRRHSPKSVALLKRALQDKHPDIRFYASVALVQIEGKMAKWVKDAEVEAAANPDSALARKDLGNRYHEYIYMGLLDQVMKADYSLRAMQCYRESIAIDPQQPDLLVRLARTCMENRDIPSALSYLDQAVNQDADFLAAYTWRAEVRFASGDVGGAIEDCRRALELGENPEKISETMAWFARN
ncbi:MAG: tetratricopeptide repeat protein [Planctomycetota bacterium]